MWSSAANAEHEVDLALPYKQSKKQYVNKQHKQVWEEKMFQLKQFNLLLNAACNQTSFQVGLFNWIEYILCYSNT